MSNIVKRLGRTLSLAVLFLCLSVTSRASSLALSYLEDLSDSVRASILQLTSQSFAKTQKLAEDNTLHAALASGDREALRRIANDFIQNALELDIVSFFDSNGTIVAVNTVDGQGKPYLPERVEKIMGMSFRGRPIIMSCLANQADHAIAEFQTKCDFTPAFFDSSGLSVAFSVPIQTAGGQKLGVISTRLNFDRITALLPQGNFLKGGNKIHLVSDSGDYFSEDINSGRAAPPIPKPAVASLIQSLIKSDSSKLLSQQPGQFILLSKLGFKNTLDGGQLYVMLSASTKWMETVHSQQRLVSRLRRLSVAAILLFLVILIPLYLSRSRSLKKTKLIERSLRQNQEWMDFSQACANAGSWAWEPSQDTALWSKSMYTLYGQIADKFVPNLALWLPLLHPDDKERMRLTWQKILLDKPSEFEFEFRIDHPEKGSRWIATRGRGFYDSATGPRMIGIDIDVTERKRLESQLLQSQKMETIGTLASGVAHDLNNQLTPLAGYLDLLLRQTLENDPNRDFLVEANVAAKRCADVTRRLLRFSRKSTETQQTIRVETMLQELKNLISQVLPSTIHVETHILGQPYPVFGNESELGTVLMNLATNARDSMPSGGRLTITAENTTLTANQVQDNALPGDYVKIFVQDTGVGMDAATLRRIFEPFFTTKPKDRGTGLGLTMVFSILKDHGGWIDVDSSPGKGTSFTIYLPKSVSADSPTHPTSDQTPLLIPFGNDRLVLLADDEEALRKMGQQFLHKLGFRVLLAKDGEEAVKLYLEQADKIALVMLDMTMPKMTGRETYLGIFRLNSKARVILVTGFTAEGDREDFIKEGVIELIRKPYAIQSLVDVLKKALK